MGKDTNELGRLCQPWVFSVVSAAGMAEDAKAETIAKFTNLTDEEYDYAKEEFDEMDADVMTLACVRSGSGTLDTAEVEKWLSADGISDHDIREYMKKFDKDGN